MSDPETLPTETAVVVLRPDNMNEVANVLGAVDTFVKDILVEDKDYGVIPGTGSKPTLLKPGAEKISKAFSLSPDYEIIEQDIRPFHDWLDNRSYTDKGTGEFHEGRDHKGYYRYVVKCRLIHMKTGETWATQIGSCDSLERGRENAPGNTILKMAQKRAFCGAILNATFCSDRFTVDVDSYTGDQAPAQRSGGQQGDGDGREMESKYGTMDKPSGCNHCGQRHIMVGDKLILKNGKWGAKACWESLPT